MQKLISWLETSFAPKMNKINHNVWVVTFKDSIMQILPFILLGSLFCVLTIPGDIFGIEWWPNFWTPFGWTMGMLSLLISFLIPFNLMEKKRLRKQRLIAGMSGIILFLMIITPVVTVDGTVGFGHSAMGAGGMFVPMIGGIFVGLVMSAFGKFSFFKEESVIPDFVRGWFDSLLPVGIVITTGWILVYILQIDLFSMIQMVFSPLAATLESPAGFIILMFISLVLYSMGISAWVLVPLTKPITLAAIAANAALGAGTDPELLNLFTNEVQNSAYMWVGGMGCTLPLVVMLMYSKANKLKALGRASFVPGLFNINEPVVFGCIAWNPIMMIPMWIIGLVLPTIVWIATKVIEFAPLPTMVFEMWYCPFPISTWLVTQSVSGLVLLGICVATASIIWYPFFKAYEKQELENDKKLEAK